MSEQKPNGNPLNAEAHAAAKRMRARMRWKQADTAARLEAWADDGMIPAVLIDGGLPEKFLQTPKALLSECTSLMAIVSGLDEKGVEYLRILLSRDKPPRVRLVLLVHAACPTKESTLLDVLALLDVKPLQVWVRAADSRERSCSWVMAATQEFHSSVIWTSSSGNFGMGDSSLTEAHLVNEADPLLVDQFVSWFYHVANAAAPLTAATAKIPALVPAQGTKEAAEMWNRYSKRCMESARKPGV